MRPDLVFSEGRFRAPAAASMDGDPGVWGDGDLLCVQVDTNGELVAADATHCDGFIWTQEGRTLDTRYNTAAAIKNIIGGKMYTVFQNVELSDAEGAASPALTLGDRVFAAAAGDVAVAAVGAIYIGVVLTNENIPGGLKLVCRVGAQIAPVA